MLGIAEAQDRKGSTGTLEEDARLTVLFFWTMQRTGENDYSKNGVGGEGGDEVVGDDEDEAPRRKVSSCSLPFDVTLRFAQPLGLHLDDFESRIIKTEEVAVRLLPVMERGKHLFGETGAGFIADEIESNAASSLQLSFFPEEPSSVRGRSRRRGRLEAPNSPSDELDSRH